MRDDLLNAWDDLLDRLDAVLRLLEAMIAAEDEDELVLLVQTTGYVLADLREALNRVRRMQVREMLRMIGGGSGGRGCEF